MASRRTVDLSWGQQHELEVHRDHDPLPYVRERCAAVLAQEATSALVIPIFDFRALFHCDAAIAIKLLAVMSRSVRHAESIDH